jgi:uncharacterized protein DUF2752
MYVSRRDTTRVLRQRLTLGLLTLTGWLALAQVGFTLGCPFKAVAGCECAFCGATRASEALLSGDVGRAIDLNLLFTVILLPACAVMFVIAVGPARWETRVMQACRGLANPRRLLRIGLIVLIAWTVARNLVALDWLAAG